MTCCVYMQKSTKTNFCGASVLMGKRLKNGLEIFIRHPKCHFFGALLPKKAHLYVPKSGTWGARTKILRPVAIQLPNHKKAGFPCTVVPHVPFPAGAAKGRMAFPKRMNFRKSSKRERGDHFQSKNLYSRFWTFK